MSSFPFEFWLASARRDTAPSKPAAEKADAAAGTTLHQFVLAFLSAAIGVTAGLVAYTLCLAIS